MSSLRPDLHRAHLALDQMPGGARVRDRHGTIWQQDRLGIYWHAEDGEVFSSFQLAQQAPLEELHAEVTSGLGSPPRWYTLILVLMPVVGFVVGMTPLGAAFVRLFET